jgi:hypothetical protein
VVTFTLTSSAIAATDVVFLNHVSGGTAGAYTLNAQPAAGSASINVRNVSSGLSLRGNRSRVRRRESNVTA